MDNDGTPSPTDPMATASRRIRPTAAKTFQCRGYGDCRMVFSRSEHLARHVRKHTGERPFSCHCGKQFSRLDNLRQHAQTVHAERAGDNDQMMRDLSSLHANMSAAAKGSRMTTARRSAQAPAFQNAQPHADGTLASSLSVKQEDTQGGLPMHYDQRPGTSTGYEGGGHDSSNFSFRAYTSNSSIADGPGGPGQHSFRNYQRNNSDELEYGHSFRASSRSPPASASASGPTSHFHFESRQIDRDAHSVQPFSGPFRFSVPEHTPVGPTSSSRPTTSSGRALPLLPSLVASAVPNNVLGGPPRSAGGLALASAAAPSIASAQSGDRVLPLPTPSVRPTTSGYASRPGTAPAGFGPPSWPYDGRNGRPGVVHRTTDVSTVQSRPDTGNMGLGGNVPTGGYGSPYAGLGHSPSGGLPSLSGGLGLLPAVDGEFSDSPFSFQPPPLAPEQSQQFSTENPRKRRLPGWDGDDGDDGRPRTRGGSYEYAGSRPATGREYEYGAGSRPQSRRISVMELCNDESGGDAAVSRHSGLLSTSASLGPYNNFQRTGSSDAYSDQARPVTSSGITLGASALRIRDDGANRTSPLGGGTSIFGPAVGPSGTSDATGTARGANPWGSGVSHLPSGLHVDGHAAEQHGAFDGRDIRRLSGSGHVYASVRHASPAAAASPAAWSSTSSGDSVSSPAISSARGSTSPASPLSPRFGWPGAGSSAAVREQRVWPDAASTGSPLGAGRRDGDGRLLRGPGSGPSSGGSISPYAPSGPGIPGVSPAAHGDASAWERASPSHDIRYASGHASPHAHAHAHSHANHPASPPPLARMSA